MLDFILKTMGSHWRFWNREMIEAGLHLARAPDYSMENVPDRNKVRVAKLIHSAGCTLVMTLKFFQQPPTFPLTHSKLPVHFWTWIKCLLSKQLSRGWRKYREVSFLWVKLDPCETEDRMELCLLNLPCLFAVVACGTPSHFSIFSYFTFTLTTLGWNLLKKMSAL